MVYNIIGKILGVFGIGVCEKKDGVISVLGHPLVEEKDKIKEKSIEGIFDAESETKGDVFEKRKTTEARLTNIEEKEFQYFSTAFLAYNSKKIRGVVLTLQNQRGTEKVDFPKEVSLTDKEAILNQVVSYTHNVWRTATEGTVDNYTLEIKSGDLAGRKLEERVFV